ncbi:MAG: MMPL family transporter [Chitinivibrionales bacterium]|nr:MMPL family transporter [Chitinivibrionales bacterium]
MRMRDRIIAAIIRYRRISVITGILLTVLSGTGIMRLRVTNEHTAFFGPENERLQAQLALEQSYGNSSFILLCIVPDSGTVFEPEVLRAIEAVRAQAVAIPHARHAEALTSYGTVSAGLGGIRLRPMFDPSDSLNSADRARIERRIMADPLALRKIVAPDAGAAGVQIYFAKQERASDASSEIAQAVHRLMAEFERNHSDMSIYATGGYLLDDAFAQASYRDLRRLMPLMIVIIAAILWFVLTDLSAMISVMIVIAASSLTAMGAAGWMSVVLAPPSAIAPIIIVAVGISDSIHLMLAFLHAFRGEVDKQQAVAAALKQVFAPIVLTTITTAAGFLSLNFSSVPPFRDLGNIAFIGIIAACAFSLAFLPAMILFLPVNAAGREHKRRTIIAATLSGFVPGHQRLLVIGMSMVMITCSLGLMRVELNDRFIDYFDRGFAFRRHAQIILDRLSGLDYIQCSFGIPQDMSLSDTAYLSFLNDFDQWVRKQESVAHAASLVHVLKLVNLQLHGYREGAYTIAQDGIARRIIARSVAGPHTSAAAARFISRDATASRFILTLEDVSARRMRRLESEMLAWLEAHAPPFISITTGSISLMFAHLSERNIRSMLWGIGASLLLIAVIMGLLGKSIRWGLLGLTPNLLTIATSLGIWGHIAGEAGIAISIVIAICLGIIVDDTIHLMHAFITSCRENRGDAQKALRTAFAATADAICFTSAILTGGFLVLTFSGFQPTVRMGLLSAVTIVSAVIIDLLFFSVLMLKASCCLGRNREYD